MSNQQQYQYIVTLALKEDIGRGDVTTEAIYSGREYAEAELIAKEEGVVAGLELAGYIYNQMDGNIEFHAEKRDGERIKRGQLLGVAKGQANILLSAERTVLNFMQRMSGIATMTRAFSDAISHTKTRILDTRKTIPGHRYLDKWAVRLGGGTNHRMRLDDLFLIKENHISVAGSVPHAIDRCLAYKRTHNLDTKIEIEVTDLEMLKKVLKHGGADIVMLDNMGLDHLKEAVDLAESRVKLEASGNMKLENVADVAETGVDYISVGAITHSARALDISMLFAEL